jgi:hypothetical protein
MDNKEFDDIIKKKLESLNTNGSEDAWDLFKVKWNNESSAGSQSEDLTSQDKELEEKIKKDLRDLRMPFNSKHWIILKEQLELEALFKKKLFVAKSVELIILAFLIVGVLNLWPIQDDIYHIRFYDIPMVASVPVNKESAEKFDRNEQARIAKQKAFFKSTKKIANRVIFSNESILPDKKAISIEAINNISANKAKTFETNSIKSVHKLKFDFPFIEIKDEQSTLKSDVESLFESDKKSPIAQLLNSEIKELDVPIRPTGFPDIVLNNNLSKENESTYLSFALGPKVNLINSPFDPVYGFDPYNTINTNFNISAKINKEIGPIELYAGLGYTNTSYVPRLVDEIYEPRASQYNVASLENIKFKTFNVPVGVKYNLSESNNYQLYASAGIDLNIIADSEYIIQDEPFNSQPGLPPSAQYSVNENAKLSQKEFNKGILSGGNLKDNLFATASVGLGLNWTLSTQTGIFIEPRYSHFISSKGIGPNEDKVHGLSIELGVRYQLN